MGNRPQKLTFTLMCAAAILAAALSGCISKGDVRLGGPTATPKATSTPTLAPTGAVTGDAAKVGDVSISAADFQTNVRFQRYQLIMQFSQYYQFYQQYPGDPFGLKGQLQQMAAALAPGSSLGQEVLDHMIEDVMVAKEAQKRGITVTDDEVNTAYQGLFGYYPNGTPTPTVTPTEFVAPTLDATQVTIVTLTPTAAATAAGPTETPNPSVAPTEAPTPYTAAAFQSATTNFYNGMTTNNIVGVTEPFVKNLVKAQLYSQKLSNDMGKTIATNQDLVWARHILVADKATADSVETRLKNGEDFGKVAAEVSTDTGSKDNGGDLGWFAKGTMVAEFDAAAFALKIGEISQPVQSTYGYHIIQVLGHEVRPMTASDLANAQSKLFSDWLTAQLQDPSVVRSSNWEQFVPNDPPFNAPNLDATPVPVTTP